MTDITPKPLPTSYAGVTFRSRIEARWAVFFDVLGVEWNYEREGYDLGGVWYLPDFWLPQVSMWAEVKPQAFSDVEIDKCRRLVSATKYPCLMLIGQPADHPFDAIEVTKDGEFWELSYSLTNAHGYVTKEARFYGCPSEDETFADTRDAAEKAMKHQFNLR